MKHIGIVILSLGSFFLPLFVFAAIYPFGGRIIHIQVCNTGILFSVGPPNPGFFMRMPYSRFFPTVAIPGVPTLGVAALTPVPCVVGVVPTGAGLPITVGGTAGIK